MAKTIKRSIPAFYVNTKAADLLLDIERRTRYIKNCAERIQFAMDDHSNGCYRVNTTELKNIAEALIQHGQQIFRTAEKIEKRTDDH
jgi:hypothetical protein